MWAAFDAPPKDLTQLLNFLTALTLAILQQTQPIAYDFTLRVVTALFDQAFDESLEKKTRDA